MPTYDSDWLQSLLAQQGQQQPPAGPVPQPQPQGLTLNGYNAAMGAPYAQPARPYSPTPMTADDLPGVTPLPSWLPPNVQNYIRTQPSYNENQPQGQWRSQPGQEPAGQLPTPQIGDIKQLFMNRIMRNAPTGAPIDRKFLGDLARSGHLAAGNEI